MMPTKTLYAIQFQLEDRETGVANPALIQASIQRRITGRVNQYYLNDGLVIGTETSKFAADIRETDRVVIDEQSTSDGRVSRWSIQWDYSLNNAMWGAQMAIDRIDKVVEFSLKMDYAGERKSVFRVPNILVELLEEYKCLIDGRIISCVPLPIGLHNFDTFLSGTLLSPTRMIPVVVVSKDRSTNTPLIDPYTIAVQLAGLAHVFLIDSAAVECPDYLMSSKPLLVTMVQSEFTSRALSCGRIQTSTRYLLDGTCKNSGLTAYFRVYSSYPLRAR